VVRRNVSLDAEIDAEIGRQPEGLNGDLMHDICIKLLSRQRPELCSILWNRRWGYSRRLKRFERTAFVRKKGHHFWKATTINTNTNNDNNNKLPWNYMYRVAHKKVSHKLLSISLTNIDRFSKFFHWRILWKICNKVVTKHTITLKCVATLPCEI